MAHSIRRWRKKFIALGEICRNVVFLGKMCVKCCESNGMGIADWKIVRTFALAKRPISSTE